MTKMKLLDIFNFILIPDIHTLTKVVSINTVAAAINGPIAAFLANACG
jgi:hypothetical protein